MDPVEDLNISQFLVEVCQGISPLGHIGLFYSRVSGAVGWGGVRPEPVSSNITLNAEAVK
jgi:hypothetical protein